MYEIGTGAPVALLQGVQSVVKAWGYNLAFVRRVCDTHPQAGKYYLEIQSVWHEGTEPRPQAPSATPGDDDRELALRSLPPPLRAYLTASFDPRLSENEETSV